ncbi:MAG: MFS transporter [Mariprofundaceae bacterium]
MVDAASLFRIRVFYAAYFAAMGLVLPFFPVFLAQRGMDAVAIGVMTGLLAVAKVIAPPWLGHWLDRRGGFAAKGFIVGACLLAALAALLLWPPLSPLLLAGVVLVFGVLWAAVLPMTDGISVAASEANLADYGRLRLWGSVGFVAASLAGGAWLTQRMDTGFPLALAGCMALTAWAAHGFPAMQDGGPRQESPGGGRFPPAFLALLAVSLFMQMSHGAYYGFFSLALAEAGYSGGWIGVWWVIGVGAEIVLMAVWTKPLQTMPPAPVFAACLTLAALRWLGLAWRLDPVWVAGMQILHAASFAAFHVAAVTWARRLAPASMQAAAQGWYSASGFGLGSAIGIMVCGWIVAGWGYSAAFRACAFVAIAALPLLWWLRGARR